MDFDSTQFARRRLCFLTIVLLRKGRPKKSQVKASEDKQFCCFLSRRISIAKMSFFFCFSLLFFVAVVSS